MAIFKARSFSLRSECPRCNRELPSARWPRSLRRCQCAWPARSSDPRAPARRRRRVRGHRPGARARPTCPAHRSEARPRDLDLRVFARRAEHADTFDATLRANDGKLFLARILAGLREVGVFGELVSFAEQRLDVFLREMDVMRRDLDEKWLLLLRLERSSDVRTAQRA